MKQTFWEWLTSRNSWIMNFWPVTIVWNHLHYISTCQYLRETNYPAWERMKAWRWVLWTAFFVGWTAILIPTKLVIPVNVVAVVIFILHRFWWKIPGAHKLLHAGPENFGQMILWTITVITGGFIQSRLSLLVIPTVIPWLIKIIMLAISLLRG